ncbi:MAG TPA: sigma-70 family RNA polymerase sigma factor [Ktedonobacteraceae bacterium]|jgi:RNA polymerase sigma-70 factor (ECF subfamily)
MNPQLGPEEILSGTTDDASLYDRFGQAIFAYVRLSTSSREDAEDLTLEVFTTALEQNNLAHLSDREQLAWLRRVAHNRFIDGYRRTTRHPVVELDKVVDRLFADETANPEEIMLQQETYAQLHQVVRTLPQLQQQLLRMRYGDGLRFAEIAVLLDKREDALRKLLSRTLAALRTRYKQPVQEGRKRW